MSKYTLDEPPDWSKEFRTCIMVCCAVRKLVSQLSPRFYKLDEVSDEAFDEVVALMEKHDAAEVIISELNEIIHDKERSKNLTNKYYAVKLLRHILHLHLSVQWKAHLEEPPGEQKLEKGAVILSQWFQPREVVSEIEVTKQLDQIADRVKQHLPEHLKAKYNKGTPTLSPELERLVLETMNHILYKEMGFRGNKDRYYDENNSFIEKVLERKMGIPISLAILYSAVARRLGVTCDCINFPTHFLLKWREHPMATLDKQYTFIDAFDGEFLTEIGDDLYKFTDAIPPIEVYKRMLRNLINIARNHHQIKNNTSFIRDAIEMMLETTPQDPDYQFLIIKIYLYLRINLTQIKSLLQDILASNVQSGPQVALLMNEVDRSILENENILKREIKPKHRAEHKEVQFSVGMVMKHKRYNYMCVISGWDSTCQASRDWIIQMGVHMLPRKDKQPFYNVLVEDGSIRYAADENLLHPDTYCEIPHPDVGKYFKEFTGQYYVMNSEKAQEYPDDDVKTRTTVEGRGQ